MAYQIVDCHPHIYAGSAGDSAGLGYPTISDHPASRGESQPGGHSANAADPGADPATPFEPAATADLKRRMDAHGVSRAVFIQTSSFYGFDNRYVMDSAKECAGWATGVVSPCHAPLPRDGFFDPPPPRLSSPLHLPTPDSTDPRAAALDPDNESDLAVLTEAATQCNCRGLRALPDRDNRIDSPNVRRLWARALQLGVVVNLHVSVGTPPPPQLRLFSPQHVSAACVQTTTWRRCLRSWVTSRSCRWSSTTASTSRPRTRQPRSTPCRSCSGSPSEPWRHTHTRSDSIFVAPQRVGPRAGA